LARTGTVAAALGVIAGIWSLYAYYFITYGPTCIGRCFAGAPSGASGTATVALAIALILFSFAEFVGPRSLFYLSALLGLAIDALEGISYASIMTAAFIVTVTLVTLSLAFNVLAARRKSVVSEQSHPMNLPVFG
jgi:hypothetical protein